MSTPLWSGSKRLWSLRDMLAFELSRLVFLAKEMKRLATFLDSLTDAGFRSPEQKQKDLEAIIPHRQILEDLGLVMSCAQINRIISALQSNDVLHGRTLSVMVNELSNRMEDECKLRVFLSLSLKEAEFINPNVPHFGPDFEQKFSSVAAFELDEAAKCIAFGRSTATVFHLMRVLEVGIKAFCKCLEIPDPIKPSDRNWGNILKKVREGIDQKWPTTAAKTSARAEIFDELYASLDAVKNPWRNATMHVENKYTPEEAEHIFIAVKGFMKKLASRMDEEGNPKA